MKGFLMRQAAWIIVIVLIGGVGGYVLVAQPGGARDRFRPEKRCDIAGEQMASLAERLRRFKKSHGRYPSTDEGLGVLDDFEVRIKVDMFKAWRPNGICDLYTFRSKGIVDHSSDHSLRTASRKTRDYRLKHGHPPRTLDELGQAGFAWDPEQLKMTDEHKAFLLEDLQIESVERELVIGRDDAVFLVGPAGVLSPWQMPYVYENRNDGPKTLFVDSPVDDDRAGRYSVKVDDGVYLCSVGAKGAYDEYRACWGKYVAVLCTGIGLLVLAGGLICWKIRPRVMAPAAAGLVMAAAAGAYTPVLQTPMCYIPIPLFNRRDPATVWRRRELLDKYRGAGAISDETYAKSLESMGLKPDQPAATRPGEDK